MCIGLMGWRIYALYTHTHIHTQFMSTHFYLKGIALPPCCDVLYPFHLMKLPCGASAIHASNINKLVLDVQFSALNTEIPHNLTITAHRQIGIFRAVFDHELNEQLNMRIVSCVATNVNSHKS